MIRIGWRSLAAAACTAAFAGALAAAASTGGAAAAPARLPAVLHADADGYRYTYHVPTGAEALFEIGDDPHELHDVKRLHPETLRALRRSLEQRLGVASLGDLRPSDDAAAERLRALGYL